MKRALIEHNHTKYLKLKYSNINLDFFFQDLKIPKTHHQIFTLYWKKQKMSPLLIGILILKTDQDNNLNNSLQKESLRSL